MVVIWQQQGHTGGNGEVWDDGKLGSGAISPRFLHLLESSGEGILKSQGYRAIIRTYFSQENEMKSCLFHGKVQDRGNGA